MRFHVVDHIEVARVPDLVEPMDQINRLHSHLSPAKTSFIVADHIPHEKEGTTVVIRPEAAERTGLPCARPVGHRAFRNREHREDIVGVPDVEQHCL